MRKLLVGCVIISAFTLVWLWTVLLTVLVGRMLVEQIVAGMFGWATISFLVGSWSACCSVRFAFDAAGLVRRWWMLQVK